jgi:hypothetical protein
MKVQLLLVQDYRTFHGFGQAKFPDDGLALGSSQFSVLPQLPPKIFGFRLEPIFSTAPAASKNTARFKSGHI